MRSILMMCLISLFTLADRAAAQIETRGRAAVHVAGFGTVQDGSSSVTTVGGISYFATQGLELGGDVSVSFFSFDTGDGTSESTTNGYITARARYNFVGQSLFVPYLSFGIGTSIDASEFAPSIVTYNSGAGFKRFLNERVSFNGEINYSSVHSESDFGSATSSAVNFLVGISIYTAR